MFPVGTNSNTRPSYELTMGNWGYKNKIKLKYTSAPYKDTEPAISDPCQTLTCYVPPNT